MSQFFPSGGQSFGISASASVLPVNIQDGLVGFPCIQGTPCCPVKCKQGTLAETTEKEELSYKRKQRDEVIAGGEISLKRIFT